MAFVGGTGGGAGFGGGGSAGGNPADPGGGIGPLQPVLGAARDLSVVLTPDGTQLLISLTPNDNQFYGGSVTYTIFWLDPGRFSQSDVYGQTQANLVGNGLSIVQGRSKVTDIQGGAGVVSATLAYAPYISGGWMYAVVLPAGSTREYRLSGTNFVAVPAYSTTTAEPLVSEIPVNVSVQEVTGLTGVNRYVQFGWQNAATLSTVSYIQIAVSNFMKDNAYQTQRTIETYRVNTKPGAFQGALLHTTVSNGDLQQGVTMREDLSLGLHNITWYFVPMTASLVPLRLSACPTFVSPALG